MVFGNKKGESTTGSMIGWVVGLILLGLLIWGLTTNWKFFSSGTQNPTSTAVINTMIQSCNTAAQGNNYESYCNDFGKKIVTDGKTKYVNCEYSGFQGGIGDTALLCPDVVAPNPARELGKCQDLIKGKYGFPIPSNKVTPCEKYFEDTYANDKLCSTVCNGF